MVENKSGLQPVEFKVLVKPDATEERTDGGLFIPEQVRDREKLAQVKAMLLAKGGNAFEDWVEPIPRVGDRVYVAKYAGIRVVGDDGETYQIANDKDIAGIILPKKED